MRVLVDYPRAAIPLTAAFLAIAFWANPNVSARPGGERFDEMAQAVRSGQSPAVASIPALLRQPYLQRMSAHSVTIVWATYETGTAQVRFQPAAGGDVITVPAVTTLYTAARTGLAQDHYQHEATLTGLAAGVAYRYDIFLNGVDLTATTDSFTTAPANGTGTISFVVFGDSGSGNANQEQIAELIAADFQRDRWDLAIHTGDIVYPSGTYQHFQDRFFSVYEDWLRGWPIYFGLGNHEYYAANAQPYLDLFVAPDNAYDPLMPQHRERYYSFDFGPVHFVSLDTNAFNGNASRQQQLTWLVRDLESTSQPWRIVFMHIPSYGASDSDYNAHLRTALQPIFERYGVQLVLAGHEHDYGRGTPWREPGSAYSPVMHVVSGGGGAGLNTPSPAPWLAHWARVYHYLSVTVSDCLPASSCALTLEAIGADGQTFDAFSLPLRAQQQDAAPPQITWMSPSNGGIVSGATTVAAAVTDDQQVLKVDLWIDGVLRAVDAAPPYEWTWNTTQDLNGERTLELRAIDIAGRVTRSEPRPVLVRNAQPTIRLLSPQLSERVFTDIPFKIRWAAEGGTHPLTGFRVELAADGKTFQPLAGCEVLPATARECAWIRPAPVSTRSRIRLTAVDQAGTSVSELSPVFRVQTGVPTLAVAYPNTAISLGVDSNAALRWTTKLANSPLQVEVSRDGGNVWESITRPESILNGELRWTVTGPTTTQGLLRVRSLNMSVQDTSNALFAIAAPSLAVLAPTAATVWTANSTIAVRWKTNLGANDRVNVRLSTDGGTNYPIVLAGSVQASNGRVTIRVPSVATQSARVMVESLVNPDWRPVSPTFRIAP